MPFNGSGGFVPLAAPTFPAVPDTVITAEYFNNNMLDIFTGFGEVVTRNGQSPFTADLPAGGFKITNLGTPSINGDSLAWGKPARVTNLTVTGVFESVSGPNRAIVTVSSDGTTVITVPFAYTTGNDSLMVYLNGSLLPQAAYTETSTTSVTFGTGLFAGDEIVFIGGQSINPSFLDLVTLGMLSASDGSSLVGTNAGGTGASTETQESYNRRLRWAESYSSFANYKTVAEPLTQAFFTQNGAKVLRIPSRAMFGGAALNDCAYPNVNKDWLGVLQVAAGLSDGGAVSVELAVMNAESPYETAPAAFLAAIQTKEFVSAGTSGLAINGYAINNHPTLGTSAWAYYGEAWKTSAAAASVYGMELDVRTTVGSITPNAYTQGDIIDLQLACGAELSGGDASAAIQIAANPHKFKVGINFLATSITGTDGVTGAGVAISMAKGHTLQWYVPGGSIGAGIRSEVSVANKASTLLFMDNGVRFVGDLGQLLGQFEHVAGAVNYPTMLASTTGNGVIFAAVGSDANVDMILASKGTGVLAFGTRTAIGAETVTGYITIKDAAGTLRKLAVVS